MINLLSDNLKASIRAARTNVLLLRYMSIIALAFAFIGGAMYISYTLLQQTMGSAEQLVSSYDVKADIYSDTKAQVDELSGKLNEANAIANQEVLYSKVLVKMGAVMPAGTVISDLKLEAANFVATPAQLTVYAKSATEAGQIQSALQSSPLFSQVTLVSTESENGINGYPVNVSLTVLLNRAGAL
jgi:hypothetical protein